MTTLRILALLVLCALTINAQNPFTNADIINLTKSGFSAEVIVAKIKQARGNFDTSAGGLQQLKKEGVSEAVIVAMIDAEQRPVATISTPLIVPALVNSSLGLIRPQ